ncbi:MAG: MFS transporter [Pseudomonadota bacterium]
MREPASTEPRSAAGGGTAPTPWPPARYGWIAVALISLATTLNFLDGTIFRMMIELIKRDLTLTDIQLGMLLGPASVLFYLFVGIPLARLADIYPRKVVLAIGMIITSGFTALGGLSQSYGQLFASRMFVGVGGSAHAPASFSMLADWFPPRRLPRAIAGMQIGFVLGMSFAGLFGGWLVTTVSHWEPSTLGPLRMFGWQWVLLLMGVPGLLTAALFLCLREPTRRGRIAGDKGMSLREVIRQVHARRKVYYPLFAGLALISVEMNGVLEWRVPFMMRTYGWTPLQVGAWTGSMVLVIFPLGIFSGAALTEYLSRRYKDAALRTTAIALALSVPFAIASPLMPTGELAIIVSGFAMLFAGTASVPQNAAIQTVTPNEMRAQLTAIHLFVITTSGALGSLLIAFITQIVLRDESKLWLSIFIPVAALLPPAVYLVARAVKPYGREIERLEAEGKL